MLSVDVYFFKYKQNIPISCAKSNVLTK